MSKNRLDYGHLCHDAQGIDATSLARRELQRLGWKMSDVTEAVQRGFLTNDLRVTDDGRKAARLFREDQADKARMADEGGPGNGDD